MTLSVPIFDPSKKRLPSIYEFSYTSDWLIAVRDCLGKDIVFALDEALMYEESYLGRNDQWVVWIAFHKHIGKPIPKEIASMWY